MQISLIQKLRGGNRVLPQFPKKKKVDRKELQHMIFDGYSKCSFQIPQPRVRYILTVWRHTVNMAQ